MAFPNLLKRLFDSNGAGVTLRGDIMPYGTAAPKAHGTAAAGSAETLSRSDHVHPLQTSVSGNAGSATKLAAKRTIDGMQFDGSANITHYGTCSTAAATAAKTVTLPNFVLATGALAFVRFTVTNTASSPTLNVNATGAKAIRYRNATISAGYLAANRTYCFIYDGSYYQLVGDIDTNTKCSVATTSSAGIVMPKTGDEDGLELGEDGSLRVRQASASQRGSVLASVTAAANAVPQAGEDGTLDESWTATCLQLSGGTLTGAVAEALQDVTGVTVALDLKTANNFTHAVADDTTFTVTAHADSSFQLGTLVLTNGGTSAVTWPDSFKWADGVPPSLMASGVDVITFFTIDGGVNYYAAQVMTGIE